MSLSLSRGFYLATLPQNPDWWSVAVMVVLLEVSLISTQELWSSARVSSSRGPRLLSLTGRPALGRVPVVPNFFHLRIMKATVLLGTFNTAEMFFCLPQDCLNTILSLSSAGSSFDFMAWFLLRYALLAVRRYMDRCVCLSKSCPMNWIYWTPIKVSKHLAYISKILFSLCHYGLLA